MDKIYKLEYLPLFEQDMEEIKNYITNELKNPSAALRLINDTEKAIQKRLKNPSGFKPYNSVRDRRQPYYRINIRNYSVFYVLIDDIMEVRRFIYAKRNLLDIV
ncbi:MAG: type II toxin-antitoxin system RelE/ParE family toxin [Oscillospiraceae bacterium]|nr:type II toxin-antitoxin system RelE/ParE family toxin [Oscillospiraceae bacterium]